MIGHNFILEGIDGTGKTTIAHRLDQELDPLIKTSLMTSSVFDPPFCSDLKKLLCDPCLILDWQIEACLFGAIFRYHHHAFTSHIKEGMVNICDRGYISMLAYQKANGADGRLYHILDMVYDDEFYENTNIIILDTDDINIGLGRTEMDRFTYKGKEYYTKVRDLYRQMEDSNNTHLINADRPVEEVYDMVKSIVVNKLREKNLID